MAKGDHFHIKAVGCLLESPACGSQRVDHTADSATTGHVLLLTVKSKLSEIN